jgi:hypothetical protein
MDAVIELKSTQQQDKVDNVDERLRKVEIKRSVLTNKIFDDKFKRISVASGPIDWLQRTFSSVNKPTAKDFASQLNKRIPSISMVRDYKIKEDFLADVISGVTVTVMQLTQGIEY